MLSKYNSENKNILLKPISLFGILAHLSWLRTVQLLNLTSATNHPPTALKKRQTHRCILLHQKMLHATSRS